MTYSDSPVFSILVAAYNAETYIRDCLESLLHQSLTNIQIVCIDDASNDSTWDILKEYTSCDNRITLIHNLENIGPAKSRNRGIEVATGKYICFLDSDDWFDGDSLQKTYELFQSDKNIDCVLFRLLLQHYSNNKIVQTEEFKPSIPFEKPLPQSISGMEALEYSINWRIHGVFAAKNNLFKTYPYDTTCRFFSDDNTTRIQFLHSQKVAFGEGVYNYRRFKESGTTKISINSFDHMIANMSLKKQLIDANVNEHIMSILETHRFQILLSSFRTWWLNKSSFNKEQTYKIKSIMKEVCESLEISKISKNVTSKFGYIPFHNFKLFYLEQYIFWTLRSLLRLDK